jgi:hypothetical protein
MIKVNLQQIAPTGGHNSIVEMPAVPCIGDHIDLNIDDGAMMVRTVIWTPGNKEYDVQVRFR